MAIRLYEMTLVGSMLGVEIVNRWNYSGDISAAPSGGAFGLLSAMGFVPVAGVFPATTLAAALAAATSNGLEWRQALCKAIYTPADFIDLPFVPVAAGTQSGDVEAAFVSLGVRSNRVRTDISRGYKRFGGVNESLVNSFGQLTGSAVTLLQAIADKMTSVLTFTEGAFTNTYTPVVVKKLKYTTPSGKFAYKYNPDEAAQMLNLASGITWEGYSTVRSQVSRQFGHGG
jgi:hypothetical protein